MSDPTIGTPPGTDTPYGLWVDAGAHTLALGIRSGVVAQPGRPAGDGADMAVAVADIVARAAANAGGLEVLLAACPAGSRQAELVRQLVWSVTPKPAGLLSLRTQPVRVTLDVSAELATVTEQFTKEFAAVQRVVENATSEIESEAARTLAGAMNDLYRADKDQWRGEITQALRDILTRRGLPATVPVEVVDTGPNSDLENDALTTETFEEATGRSTWPSTYLEPADWTATAESYAARAGAEPANTEQVLDAPPPGRTSGRDYVGALAQAWAVTEDLQQWIDQAVDGPRPVDELVKAFLASHDPYPEGMKVYTRGSGDLPVRQWVPAEIVERGATLGGGDFFPSDPPDEWVVELDDGETVFRDHTELHPADEDHRAQGGGKP